MKKLIIATVLMALCPTLRATAMEPEQTDTVKIIEHADIVTVTREGNTTTIESMTERGGNTDLFTYSVTVDNSGEDDWDIDSPFYVSGKNKEREEGRLQKSLLCGEHFYIGRRFNYSDKGNIKNFFEIGVRDLIGVRWSLGENLPSFSIGLGWSAQFYHTQDGFTFGKEGSSLIVKPLEEGQRKEDALLEVYTFQIPLTLNQMITKNLKFTLGGVACFNTYARASSTYTEGGLRHKVTYKGLQQRLFTADLYCGLGINHLVGIYAAWSPMSLFKAPYGPQLKSWSIGASLAF